MPHKGDVQPSLSSTVQTLLHYTGENGARRLEGPVGKKQKQNIRTTALVRTINSQSSYTTVL